MAIAAPSDEVIRLVEALGLRTKNTREVTLRMAVNEVVAVNTVEYVNGEQIDALAAKLNEMQYRLARWIPVEERLPEMGARVMVGHAVDGWVGIGERVLTGTYLHWEDDGEDLHEPTHWMPLPEPPDEAT